MSVRACSFLACAACGLLAIGCASVDPVPVVHTVGGPEKLAAASPPNDLLWYRTSAEMRALYEQAYRVAGERISSLSKDFPKGTWAVVMDADETILNNSEFRLRAVQAGHDVGSWNDWVREKRATALPGSKQFIEKVHALGGRVVVVTNREQGVCDATESNFESLMIVVDGILCSVGSADKNARFESVKSGSSKLKLPPLAVIAFVGDNIHFPNRTQANPGSLDRFGESYFIMPNPSYGSWDHNVLK